MWGHDVVPAATDPHMRCIGWLGLADQVGGGCLTGDVWLVASLLECEVLSQVKGASLDQNSRRRAGHA